MEDRIILRGMATSIDDFNRHIRYMRSEADYLAMPSIGLILGSTHTVVNTGGVPKGVPPNLSTL